MPTFRCRLQPLTALLVASISLSACATHPLVPSDSHRRDLRFSTEKAARLQQPHLFVSEASSLSSTATATATRAVATRLLRLAPLSLLPLQSDEEVTDLEKLLQECVQKAEREVNQDWYRRGKIKGPKPTRAECREEVEVDGCPKPITIARALGRDKHAAALMCAKEVLKTSWPNAFRIEQRYRYYRHARFLELVSPEEEARLIKQGCTKELWRTIKPDIVLHLIGDPLRAALTFDLKFPCPDSNQPKWTDYDSSSAYAGSNQGEIYQEALGGEIHLLSPKKPLP